MSLRVAVIGAGHLGQHHARIYSEMDGVDLVGIADISFEKAAEVAKRYGSTPYNNYREILHEADAFSIAVPTTSHYATALDCLKAGKDILVEKPVAATLAEADELIAEAGRLNCILQVGHLERYNPPVMAVSEVLEEPLFFESFRLSPFLNRATDVSVTVDLMIHDIDIVMSLVSSPIRRINAAGLSLITKKIDEARAWIEFENGIFASFAASRISPEKQRRLRIFQKNSYIDLDYQHSEIRLFSKNAGGCGHAGASFSDEGGNLKDKAGLPFRIIRPEPLEPLREELKDFVRCVVARERPKVSGIEGRGALMVALEINSLIKKALAAEDAGSSAGRR